MPRFLRRSLSRIWNKITETYSNILPNSISNIFWFIKVFFELSTNFLIELALIFEIEIYFFCAIKRYLNFELVNYFQLIQLFFIKK